MGGTPAAWENATPIYGIRYPKPTAPAQYLPDMFQHTGLDVEAALQTASIPAVTPAPVMVAATAGARDAFWGVPANETERLTLQNRGATTLRTDTGTTERYFATYNASTNAGGRTPAGWYVVQARPSYAEITQAVVGLADQNLFTQHAYALDAATSAADTGKWLSIATPNITLQPGTYSMTWTSSIGALATGRTFLQITDTGSRPLLFRSNITPGDDNGSVSAAALRVAAATAFTFALFKVNGTVSNSSGRILITRYPDTA